MQERNLNDYLEKVDSYVMQSVELIEAISILYGKYIDSAIEKSQFSYDLNQLSGKFRSFLFETGNLVVYDDAPDSFQDLDSAFHVFISMCDNCIINLFRLLESEKGNHWLINKTFDDCRTDYNKLLKFRKNSEIISILKCNYPLAIRLRPDSRALESINQNLNKEKFILTKIELSADADFAQLNIELASANTEKQDILDLSLRCFQVIRDDLENLSQIKSIYLAFRTSEKPPSSWIRVSRDALISFLASDSSTKELEKILEIHYFEDLNKAAKILSDLALNSLTKDYEMKEVLNETARQLEAIKQKAISDKDFLVDLTLKHSFQNTLLNSICILFNFLSITKNTEVAKRTLDFFNMFKLPDQVNVTDDYSKLSSKFSELAESLIDQYIVLPKIRPIHLDLEMKTSPRIALVQPKISFRDDYVDFCLTNEGAKRHIKLFEESLADAVKNNADVIVFPELFFPVNKFDYLKRYSIDKNMIIITGLDYEYPDSQIAINSCAIALPNGEIIRQKKMNRSKYDLPLMVQGEELPVFNNTPIGNFIVLICYDYLELNRLAQLRGIIDAIFIISMNPDESTFNLKAQNDAYSTIFGFIIISNVFAPNDRIQGNSGIYGPLKETNKILDQFADQETGVKIIELPLGELRKTRTGSKSSIIKSPPAGFKNKFLANDYVEEDIKNIKDGVLKKIKDLKRQSSSTDTKNYEMLKESIISRDINLDLESNGYGIMDLEEKHTGKAKRLAAFLLVKKGISKEKLKKVVINANNKIKKFDYYSNSRQESRYQGKIADVVWLYFFNERKHKRHLYASDYLDYFVCKTQWINPMSSPRPPLIPLNGAEIVEEIEIEWNKNYEK